MIALMFSRLMNSNKSKQAEFEEVVSRHCLDDYIEYEIEGVVLSDLVGIKLILQ